MSLMYTYGMTKFLNGGIDLDTNDIRMLAVMSNSTAPTDEDAQFVGDIGTLDEDDATGYVRVALAAEAVSAVTASDRAKFTSDPVGIVSTVADATRQVIGMVFFRFVTNDADSPVICYIDSGGFPYTPDGTTKTISPHPDGWFYARNAV